jgi:RNA polymerase sigma-70 factor (ECF subfamily)
MNEAPSSPAASARAELDELTLRRARKGDRVAQRALIERYQHMVFACVARLTCSRGRNAIADDLVQETFVRVLGALDRFEPSGSAKLSTWILTIATRLALNELRRKQVTPDDVVPLAGDAQRPDRALEQQAVSAAVRRAIAALPVDQRAVLILREYHELDYADIAHALELDLGTVKSRLSRAREALRNLLQEVHHG